MVTGFKVSPTRKTVYLGTEWKGIVCLDTAGVHEVLAAGSKTTFPSLVLVGSKNALSLLD